MSMEYGNGYNEWDDYDDYDEEDAAEEDRGEETEALEFATELDDWERESLHLADAATLAFEPEVYLVDNLASALIGAIPAAAAFTEKEIDKDRRRAAAGR